MKRKRLTEIIPILIPLRIWQTNLFYHIGMKFDKNKYSNSFSEELLPYEVCSSDTLMINEDSGYDITYQKNKVHNLKIISKTMNKILIYPNETFSFCYLSKNSKRFGKYKEGLVLVDNKIVPKVGGGICHLSNLLYYVFLMSPLTIVERHGHRVKSLPNPDKDALEGVDATIHSGWLDLKVRNDTDNVYQIVIDFDDKYMYAKILAKNDVDSVSIITNDNFKYIKKDGKIFESVSVIKETLDKESHKSLENKKLYDEVVEVSYELPEDVEIEEMD